MVETAKRTGASVSGPIPLPTERSLYTIIRATHKIQRLARTIRNAYTQTSYRHCEPEHQKLLML